MTNLRPWWAINQAPPTSEEEFMGSLCVKTHYAAQFHTKIRHIVKKHVSPDGCAMLPVSWGLACSELDVLLPHKQRRKHCACEADVGTRQPYPGF
jgi:hypothetical protein